MPPAPEEDTTRWVIVGSVVGCILAFLFIWWFVHFKMPKSANLTKAETHSPPVIATNEESPFDVADYFNQPIVQTQQPASQPKSDTSLFSNLFGSKHTETKTVVATPHPAASGGDYLSAKYEEETAAPMAATIVDHSEDGFHMGPIDMVQPANISFANE